MGGLGGKEEDEGDGLGSGSKGDEEGGGGSLVEWEGRVDGAGDVRVVGGIGSGLGFWVDVDVDFGFGFGFGLGGFDFAWWC